MLDIDSITKKVNKFYKTNPDWLVFFVWATATGKSGTSIEVIRKWIDAEVISSDSRQLYRYMNIWTDKVSQDIMDEIPHHQIDILDPNQPYTAGDWKKETEKLIEEIQWRWKKVFVVWWTWLYTSMLYKNFSMPDAKPDMEFRKKLEKEEEDEPGILHKKLAEIDPSEAMIQDPRNIRYIIRALEIFEKTGKPKSEVCKELPVKWPMLIILLRREREETNKRINTRIKEMIKEWLLEEVQWLLDQWYSPKLQAMQGIGYKEIVWHLQWKYNLADAIELLKRNTHHYAKKQRTWFRRYIADSANPKENVEFEIIRLS